MTWCIFPNNNKIILLWTFRFVWTKSYNERRGSIPKKHSCGTHIDLMLIGIAMPCAQYECLCVCMCLHSSLEYFFVSTTWNFVKFSILIHGNQFVQRENMVWCTKWRPLHAHKFHVDWDCGALNAVCLFRFPNSTLHLSTNRVRFATVSSWRWCVLVWCRIEIKRAPASNRRMNAKSCRPMGCVWCILSYSHPLPWQATPTFFILCFRQ